MDKTKKFIRIHNRVNFHSLQISLYLKRCIPELDERMISRRGVTGILVEFMNENGFSGEPVVLRNDKSINILYVGGATAAPAFTASTVKDIQNWGYLDGLKKRTTMAREPFWKFDLVEI
ncbi:MAG: hypothetical protein M1422_07345 [Candidatus Thermoplasmatota archaeon]|nr:hypothetical protein [Candidatus Thermoplasmatota archaeon]